MIIIQTLTTPGHFYQGSLRGIISLHRRTTSWDIQWRPLHNSFCKGRPNWEDHTTDFCKRKWKLPYNTCILHGCTSWVFTSEPYCVCLWPLNCTMGPKLLPYNVALKSSIMGLDKSYMHVCIVCLAKNCYIMCMISIQDTQLKHELCTCM